MKNFIPVVFTILILTGTTGIQFNPAFSQNIDDLPQKIHASDRLIVKFNPGVSSNTQENILSSNSASVIDHLPLLDINIVSVPEPAIDSIKNALSKNNLIEFAEYDFAAEPSTIPNDQYFGNQWYLPKINSPQSYDITHGEGFPIVVLDSGIDMDHSDLNSKIIYPYNGLTQTPGPVDHVNGCGHGTPVAGAAAAITNNNNGIAGVGWDTQIIPVKITDDSAPSGQTQCYGWSNGVLRGVEWAVSHGARVVNLSYGFDGSSSSIRSAAQLLQDNNGWLVISAGNSGNDPNNTDDPRIIFVSATNSGDTRSSFSSYGDYVDISAPGSSIYTTSNGNSYNNWSGTSFSAPITASVLNLIYSVDPTLTSSQAYDILKNSAKDLGPVGWDQEYGYGRVDAYAAVLAASNGAPTITAGNDSYITDEEISLNIPIPGILGNDLANNGGTLTASISTTVSNGVLNLNSNGSFTYTPSQNFDGIDSFTYRATSGSEVSNIATVTISVNPINDAPIAHDDLVTTLENTSITIDVLQNDLDVDGDILEVQSFSQGTNGTVSKNADGTLSYLPNTGFFGSDNFSYLVYDGSESDEGTVNVNVIQPIPVHVGDLEITKTGNKRWTAHVGVTVHDDDHFPASGLTVHGYWSGGSSDSGSCITNSNGMCQISMSTRDSNLAFSVTNIVGVGFEYTGQNHDQNGNSDGTSIAINSDGTTPGQNTSPIANDDSVSTNQDQQIQINVLSNDSDPNGDSLSIQAVAQGNLGSVDINGSFVTYTPDLGITGEDSFVYTISDGKGGTDTATVYVSINGPQIITKVHAGLIEVELGKKGPWNTGTVIITVHDPNHGLQSGVTVSGTWGGLFSGNTSCTTDTSGTCFVTGKSRESGPVLFSVTGMSGNGFEYDATADHPNSSSITFNLP